MTKQSGAHVEWTLLGAILLDMIGYTMLIPNIQLRADHLLNGVKFSGVIIAFLLQSTFVLQLIFSPIFGKLADRKGRVPVFVVCQTLSALAMLVYGLAGSISLLFVSRILAGFGAANIAVAQAMIASHVEDSDRTQALGRAAAAVSLGMVSGPALGGLLGDTLGYALLGFVGAGLSFFGGFLVVLAAPNLKQESIANHGEVSTKLGIKESWGRITGNRVLLGVLSLSAVASFSLALLEGTYGRLIKYLYGYGATVFGIIFSWEALLTLFASSVLLGVLKRKFSDGGVLRLGYVWQGLGLAAMPFAAVIVGWSPLWILFLSSAGYALGVGLVGPALNANASKSVPKNVQGELFGLLQSARAAGFIVGPLVGGLLFDYNKAAPYLVAGGVCIVCALALPRLLNQNAV